MLREKEKKNRPEESALFFTNGNVFVYPPM